MSIRFNHTLVYSTDKKEASSFLTDILGLPAATPFGPFLVVELENGASLDFLDVGNTTISPQHYAFLIDEEDFDPIFERIRAGGRDYWADPFRQRVGEINRNDGGRGVSLDNASGHFLKFLTMPSATGQCDD